MAQGTPENPGFNPGDNKRRRLRRSRLLLQDYLRDNWDDIIRLIICFALSPGLSDYRQHGRASGHVRTAQEARKDRWQGGRLGQDQIGACRGFKSILCFAIRRVTYQGLHYGRDCRKLCQNSGIATNKPEPKMHILTKQSETQDKEYILTDGCDGQGKEIFQIQTMQGFRSKGIETFKTRQEADSWLKYACN